MLLGLLGIFAACGKADGEVRVREATHADDGWYPSKASELAKVVDGYLAKAKKEAVSGKIVALIVPHAGYRFCGQVAAYAYKQIQGMEFDTVVIVGLSHSYGFPGAAIYESGVFRNPLGDVEVDSVTAKLLMKENSAIKFIPQAHIPEHSIENQIPFLQRALSKFKIVPILIVDSSKQNCDMLSSALVKVLKGKKALLIASSDMSHYPQYDEAVKADKVVMTALETMNTDLMRRRMDEYMRKDISNLRCMLCGEGAVFAVVDAAKGLGADSAKVIKHANSGDVPGGNKDEVVGYMAAMLYGSGKSGEQSGSQKSSAEALDAPINKEQGKVLLKIARHSIENYLRTGKREMPQVQDQRLKVKQGAFVTLRKNGMLRGCIGYILPIEPLCDTVAKMAIEAATEDYRFRPVTPEEMKDISIEISVLSVPRRAQSADEIEMGKHGVIVRRGANQGVYLPQVATETGWDRQTFLEHLCQEKAGLPKDAWKDKNTELLIFTAQIIEEE